MKIFLLLCLFALGGCTVLHDAKTEFQKDLNGFRADFARVYFNKPTDVDLLLKDIPDHKSKIAKVE